MALTVGIGVAQWSGNEGKDCGEQQLKQPNLLATNLHRQARVWTLSKQLSLKVASTITVSFES